MNKSRQPNEIEKKSAMAKKDNPVLHNAVSETGVSVVLKKKRYYGGLMCPPMGSLPTAAEPSEKSD